MSKFLPNTPALRAHLETHSMNFIKGDSLPSEVGLLQTNSKLPKLYKRARLLLLRERELRRLLGELRRENEGESKKRRGERSDTRATQRHLHQEPSWTESASPQGRPSSAEVETPARVRPRGRRTKRPLGRPGRRQSPSEYDV